MTWPYRTGRLGIAAVRLARTSAARTGLLAKFEREAREKLGPGASERDVALAADAAKAAHYRRMSAASAAARWGTKAQAS